jgi:2-iminoacetate synthase
MNAPAAIQPPHPVSDHEFKTLVAILRLAVPYTGIILTTRETPALRNDVFNLGVSQISAGSRTNPGGYEQDTSEHFRASQFNLGDTRTPDEVIYDITQMGHIPSFCTACYRLGRTGQDFMDLAKPGLIQKFCRTNAVLTYKEYLLDYASPATREAGDLLITRLVEETKNARTRKALTDRLSKMETGVRDLYV